MKNHTLDDAEVVAMFAAEALTKAGGDVSGIALCSGPERNDENVAGRDAFVQYGAEIIIAVNSGDSAGWLDKVFGLSAGTGSLAHPFIVKSVDLTSFGFGQQQEQVEYLA